MFPAIKSKLVDLLKKFIDCPEEDNSLRQRLDTYVSTFPSAQNALDLFKGEWASILPTSHSELKAGGVPLFEDVKIAWADQELGGFENRHILELGPLEGGHTYMLETRGAASILAIEANPRAYLKCLITKEILKLQRAQFLLGDFISYLKQSPDGFDICIASGVLYHLKNPVELIHLISQKVPKVMMWTHYYDQALLEHISTTKGFSFAKEEMEYRGFKHTVYKQFYHQNYPEFGQRVKFFGGQEEFSCWMTRQDILASLEYCGFTEVKINFEEPEHPHGPCFGLVAIKK